MDFISLREISTGNYVLINPAHIASVTVRKAGSDSVVKSVLALSIEKPSGASMRFIPIDSSGAQTPEEDDPAVVLEAFAARARPSARWLAEHAHVKGDF